MSATHTHALGAGPEHHDDHGPASGIGRWLTTTLVPSFGEWGFALARLQSFDPPTQVIAGLRSLDTQTLQTLFVLGPDMAPVPAEVNLLNNQVLVRYYEEEWRQWN